MARSSETIEPRGRAHGQSPLLGGATFELRHRLARVAWSTCWLLFARWTPPQLQPLRRLVLRAFGADIHPTAMVRSSVKIWWPGNLKMGVRASMGPGAICYNVAPVTVEDFAIVSQRAHLCTGTHDIDDPDFPLRARPISIGRSAWVAAEAFVGPGVRIGQGAVLAARAVTFRSLDEWTVYGGNHAKPLRSRKKIS